MIMVVSDHGGFTNTHGGMMYEELNTPIIFAGKGIKKNYEIQEQIYKYDVAANVCFALGLQQPQLWIGRPNKSAFAGFDEPANLWKGRKVLPPPMFITKTIINPYGGLFIDTPAVVNIQMPIDQKGEIRYTLDGSRPDKQSQLYNAPFLLNKSAVVTAAVFNESERSTFARGEYRVAKTGGNRGLSYTLYHLDKESNGLPDFDKMKPVGTGAWYDLGVVLPENEIKETPIAKRLTQFKTGMGIRFSGWIKIDKDGYYNFSIWCTGAAKLFLNGELVVNNNNNGSQHRGNGGMVYLKKGYSAIKLDMFYNRGSDRILLSTRFHLGDEPNRIVPGNILFKQKPSK